MKRFTLWVPILLLLSATAGYSRVLTLTPSLSVGESYDDNIFQEPNAIKQNDFITDITPEINLHYVPNDDVDLTFDYRPSFRIFVKNPDESFIAQRWNFDFRFPLSRLLSFTLHDNLLSTEEPGDRIVTVDQATGLRTTSRDRRQPTLTNLASASAQVQLAPRTSLGLLFDSFIENVSVADEADELRNRFGVVLGYLTNVYRRNSLSLLSNVTFYRFRSNSQAPAPPDFRVITLNLGYEHTFSPTLSGNITIGYGLNHSADPARGDDSNVVGNLRLVKTLRTGEASIGFEQRYTAGAQGQRVLARTGFVNFSSGISPKVTVGVGANLSYFDFEQNVEDQLFFLIRPTLAYQALRFWNLSVEFTYAVTNYDEATRPDETNYGLTFRSRFTLRAGWFLEVIYRYRSRQFDTVGSLRDFDRNVISLQIVYSPTLRF
jgi:hypothetical protein